MTGREGARRFYTSELCKEAFTEEERSISQVHRWTWFINLHGRQWIKDGILLGFAWVSHKWCICGRSHYGVNHKQHLMHLIKSILIIVTQLNSNAVSTPDMTKRPLQIICILCQYFINRTRHQFIVGVLSCHAALHPVLITSLIIMGSI